jgi:uncharacterized protein YbjT (DUF2867 family)
MRIVIVGATGRTGRQLVTQASALSAPHSVQSSCGSGMASWRP